MFLIRFGVWQVDKWVRCVDYIRQPRVHLQVDAVTKYLQLFSSLLITWFSFQTQSKVYFQARYLTFFRISLFWEQKSMLQKDYWTHDVISQNFTLQWAIFLWSSFFHLKYLQSSAPTKDATIRHYITHHSTFHYQIPPNPIRKGLDLSSSGVYEHLLLFLSMI